MNKSGTIKLIAGQKTLLQHKRYESDLLRQDIIDGWKEFYGSVFRNLFIHISPDPEEETIASENGVDKH